MGRKKKNRNIEKSTLKSLITSILRQNPRKAFNYKQLSKQIGVGVKIQTLNSNCS